MSKWLRAGNGRLCPVCQKKGNTWCCWKESTDGLYVICMWESAGSYKTSTLKDSSIPAYHHIVNSSGEFVRRPQLEIKDNKVASVESRHIIYDNLLTGDLQPLHRMYLHKRGWTDEQIKEYRYTSSVNIGDSRKDIAKRLSGIDDLSGVPGFWFHKKSKEWHYSAVSGILLPVIDQYGNITGCQINTNDAIFTYMRYGNAVPNDIEIGPKYVWLTSAPFEDINEETGKVFIRRSTGVKADVQPHFAGTKFLSDIYSNLNTECFIVEGVLKADRCSQLLNKLVIGQPGVGIGSTTVANFTKGIDKIVVAYDMDWLTNDQVFLSLTNLLYLIKEARTLDNVYVAGWENKYKGLDDLLDNKKWPIFHSARDWLRERSVAQHD
jgi:hypothetical protein